MAETVPPERRPAILILGPTGSGKTPLGDYLEREGWEGKRCCHFDFGANLRDIARAAGRSPEMTEKEMDIIRRSLQTGALLENEHFPLAMKILRGFAAERGLVPGDILVLNGFPRHLGQAMGLESYLGVRMVVVLEAAADVLFERIRRDAGGDRSGRTDDSAEEVRRKLEIFRERTLPLLNYYEDKGVLVVRIAVAVDTTAVDIMGRLRRR